jgi:50S ribosomal protein L16 3-hydroxylase
MLYLPPLWGHDGVAEGECMTCSIGFNVPTAGSLARDLLSRLAEEDGDTSALYRDATQPATETPAAIPPALLAFARLSLARHLAQPLWLERVLGESLTEPKPQVWFEAGQGGIEAGVRLDQRTRMMYDERHVFINGEAFRAGGRDATLMRQLADERSLSAAGVRRLSAGAADLLQDWLASGWLQGD